MEMRDPRGGVEPSKCRVGALSGSLSPALSLLRPCHFSLPPCRPRVFLGGLSLRLTYTFRWRSNGQWNTDNEFVNESFRQEKQFHSPFPRSFNCVVAFVSKSVAFFFLKHSSTEWLSMHVTIKYDFWNYHTNHVKMLQTYWL